MVRKKANGGGEESGRRGQAFYKTEGASVIYWAPHYSLVLSCLIKRRNRLGGKPYEEGKPKGLH